MTSFYPAVSNRATSQLGISRLLFQINHDQSSILDLQTQLSTGRRVNKPSQDPAAAIRALTAQRQLEFKGQIDDNLESADTLLSATESTLAQAQSILNEMRGIAVLATGTTLSEPERQAYSAQIKAAVSKLTELGNSKFRDQFIFGGSAVQTSPLEATTQGVRFNGNDEELHTITDFASTLAANITAEEAFGVRSDRVIGTVDLNPAISSSTPLSELFRGEGLEGGAIAFSNGVDQVQIDFAQAYDLNDILIQINSTALDGRQLEATLSSNAINIQYADGLGGLLNIEDVGSGAIAEGLGIANGDSGASPVNGADLNPILTIETRLDDLFGGAGINIGDSFQISQGDKTYTISTTGTETIEDLLNRIHRSGAEVKASVDASGRFLAIQSTESGTKLSIGELNSDLATVLGIRTLSETTSLKELNYDQGIYDSDQHDDLTLTRVDGTEFSINLDGVQNVGDVLNRINNHVDNFTVGLRITATLAPTGNGIVLTSAEGTDPIRVRSAAGSQAAIGLGLVPLGESDNAGIDEGTTSVIRGLDVSGVEVEGAFTSLKRLEQAVISARPEDMPRVADMIEADIQRLSMARGLIGTRQQAIANTEDLSSEQQLLLKEIESNELDADLANVISELTAREAALQASLQLMGQTSRLTLFNFI